MQSQSKNIRALLNSAYPIQVRQDQITLGCEGQFHKNKLSEEKRRALVEDVLSDVLGVKVSVECITSNESVAERESRAVPPPPSGGLFAGQAAESAIKDELRNHPTVKALERRGGQIVDIQIKQDKEGEQHGQ